MVLIPLPVTREDESFRLRQLITEFNNQFPTGTLVLPTARAFSISGDGDAPPVLFDGSGDVDLVLTITDVDWSAIDNTPTTLAGYGVTSVDWSVITGEPTTLAGYGITDAQPLDDDLTAIAALGFASETLLKKTAANTWALSNTLNAPFAIAAGSTSEALTVTTTGAVNTRMAYDSNDYATFAVSSSGQLTITSVPSTAANEKIELFGRTVISSSSSGSPHQIHRTGGGAILEIGLDNTDFMRFSVTGASNIASWRYGSSGNATDAFLTILMGVTLSDTGGSTSNSNTTALNFPGGETGRSPMRLTHGVAPSSPVNGDVWSVSGESLYHRNNGVTQFASWTEQAAVADATGAGDVVAQLNDLLGKLRTINIIST